MGSTHSCDESGECVVRACQFQKPTTDSNNGQGGAETTDFADAVDSTLVDFFGGTKVMSRDDIIDLRDDITSNLTDSMDINAGCIGFADATDPPGKTPEKFTYSTSTGSLIACTIIAIVFIVAAMFIWRWFVRRNESSVVASTPPSTDTDNESTNDPR